MVVAPLEEHTVSAICTRPRTEGIVNAVASLEGQRATLHERSHTRKRKSNVKV